MKLIYEVNEFGKLRHIKLGIDVLPADYKKYLGEVRDNKICENPQ